MSSLTIERHMRRASRRGGVRKFITVPLGAVTPVVSGSPDVLAANPGNGVGFVAHPGGAGFVLAWDGTSTDKFAVNIPFPVDMYVGENMVYKVRVRYSTDASPTAASISVDIESEDGAGSATNHAAVSATMTTGTPGVSKLATFDMAANATERAKFAAGRSASVLVSLNAQPGAGKKVYLHGIELEYTAYLNP